MKDRTRKTYYLTTEAEGVVNAYADQEDMSRSMWLSRLLVRWHKQRQAQAGPKPIPEPGYHLEKTISSSREVFGRAGDPPADYVEVTVTERDVGKTAWMSRADAGV